ncbi:uncharacterized protein LOC144641030 [Oculina patagonica]
MKKAFDKQLNMTEFSFAILFRYAAMLIALIAFSLLAVSDGCTSKSDCGVFNQVCCSNECVSSSNCIGRYCSSDSDCSSGESCCNKKCKSGVHCEGSSCSTDSDCGIPAWLNCCNGKCSKDKCLNSVLVGSLVGSISLIFIIIIIAYICARRRQRTLRRSRANNVTTTGTVQSNQPHPGQVPLSVSYQPGYPHYPPAQYEQQQHTTNPPPYNPGTMRASEQPPPSYTEATQGVYAAWTIYQYHQ